RWGTIYPECCPADRAAPTRNYTIEVTPCEFSRIELARTLGAQFALSIATRPAPIEEDVKAVSTGDDEDCCTATMKDLEQIFRIPERQQPKEQKVGRLEMYAGATHKGDLTYQLPEDAPVSFSKPKALDTRPTTPKKSPITPASGLR